MKDWVKEAEPKIRQLYAEEGIGDANELVHFKAIDYTLVIYKEDGCRLHIRRRLLDTYESTPGYKDKLIHMLKHGFKPPPEEEGSQ